MRKLYYVPTIHTLDAETHIPDHLSYLFSSTEEKEIRDMTDKYWRSLEPMLFEVLQQDGCFDGYQLTRRCRVYLDSLTPGVNWVELLEKKPHLLNGPNIRIIEKLRSFGAQLEGPEDLHLLRESIMLHGAPAFTTLGLEEVVRGIEQRMVARDKYIAATIEKTLEQDETGILFMGAAHDVSRYLRTISCRVICPIELVPLTFKKSLLGKPSSILFRKLLQP